MALALTAATIIVVILFAASVTITNAQQQQQQQQLMNSSQPAEVGAQNATLFENRHDSFRVQVPEGWVIHDVNNTGSVLAAEATQGYGILAQLCPGEEGEQQQEESPNNISTSTACPQVQQAEEIIHIIRYPNLGARIAIDFEDINNTVSDSVLDYVIQKLREVGYRDISVINNTDTTIGVPYLNNIQPEQLSELGERFGLQEATVPARLVEVTYSTDSAPGEIRRGFLILTATNATPTNVETITWYIVFYESVRAAASAEEETTTAPSGSSVPPPAVVRQIFDSFELIPSEEVRESILRGVAEQLIGNLPEEEEEEEEP